MANGTDYAPDYPTAPAPPRPVDKNTLLGMVGQQMQFSGLGKVFSAGQKGPQAAATAAAYNRMGAQAAENMRNRFYKKEWEQVHSTRLKPLIDQLQTLKAQYEAQSAIATRPTPRTIGLEEGAAIKQLDTDVQPGGAAADGKAQPTTVVPGQNPALSQGGVGTMAMEDKLSIVNPDTGMPVSLDSLEGFGAHQKLVDNFWRGYEQVNVQIMDVLAEYQGNPFVDHAAGTMIENVMKQAGHGVTGQMDPLEQEAYITRRDREASEREAAQLAKEQAQHQLQGLRGQRAAGLEGARSLAGDPIYGAEMGGPLSDKLRGGGPLTPQDEATAAALYENVLKQEERRIKLAAATDVTKLPNEVLRTPTNTQAYLQKSDRLWDDYVQQDLGDVYSSITTTIANDPEAFIAANPGLEPGVVREIRTGGLTSPSVQALVNTMAMKTPEYRQSSANATARRLHEITGGGKPGQGEDPRAMRMVDEYLDQWRASDAWNDDFEEEYQTDKIGLFTDLTTDTRPTWRPPNYEARVNKFRENQERDFMRGFERGPAPAPVSVDPNLAPAPEPAGAATTPDASAVRSNMSNKPVGPLAARGLPKRQGEYDIRTVDINTLSHEQRQEAHRQLSNFLTDANATLGMPPAELKQLRSRLKELSQSFEGPIQEYGRKVKTSLGLIGSDISEVLRPSREQLEQRRAARESSFKVGSSATIGSPAMAAGQTSVGSKAREFVDFVKSVPQAAALVGNITADNMPPWLKQVYDQWSNDMSLIKGELSKADWRKALTLEAILNVTAPIEKAKKSGKPWPAKGKSLFGH